MFSVGDLIVYHDGKVYKIMESVIKDYGKGPQEYFVLTQYELYNENKNTVVYVPQEKIEDLARKLLSYDEARSIVEKYPSIEPMRINDSKQRKTKFQDLCSKRDPLCVLKIIKSFIDRNENLKKINKTLTITDKRMLEKLKKDVLIEFSIVLENPINEVESLFGFHGMN